MRSLPLLILAVLLSLSGYAQNPVPGIEMPKVVSPSPEAASLGKFGDVPVSLYNGIPSINIPLYSIPLDGNSLSLSLGYHSNGLKVAEDASWVGLGFALSGGGTITRSVAGFDDFLPDGYLNAPAIPSDLPSNPTYISDIASGAIDTEPDIFVFNFMGRSGKFVLKKGMPYNSTSQILQLTSSPLKITCNRITAGQFTFQITDEKGFKYFFEVQETSTTLGSSGATQLSAEQTMTYNSSKDIDVPTAWHLTRIVSPYNKEITLEYDRLDVEGRHKYFTLSSKAISESYPLLHTHSGCAISNPQSVNPQYKISVSQSVTKNAYLKRIIFDNGQVEFITSAREDMAIGGNFPGKTGNHIEAPRKLDEIRVTTSNQQVKSFRFVYDYYNKQNIDKIAHWRLRLDSILLKGNTALTYQAYAFEYNGINLPSKESCDIDYWGYYNASGNDGRSIRKLVPEIYFTTGTGQTYHLEGADREPDSTMTQAGLLTKVHYPTGGSVALQYELNRYAVMPAYEDPGDRTMYLAIGTPPSQGPEGYYEDTLKVKNHTTVSVWCSLSAGPSEGVWISDTLMDANAYGIRFAEILPVGSNIPVYGHFYGHWYSRPDHSSNTYVQQTGNLQLAPGNYIYRVYKHKEFKADMNIEIRIADNAAIVPPDPNRWVDRYTGGLRVKKITEDYGTGAPLVKNYDYTTKRNNYIVSSAKILAPTVYYYDGQYIEQGVPVGGGQVCTQTLLSRTFTSNSNIPIASSASGYHIGYDKVTEHWNNGTANGYTGHFFENQPEIVNYPAVPGTPGYGFHNLNGKLWYKSIISAAGDTLQTEYYQNTQYDGPFITGLKTMSGVSVGMTPQHYLYGFTYYNIQSNFVVPTETRETMVTSVAGKLEKKKEFTYNTTTHYQLTEEKEYGSDGLTVKRFRYPQDTTFAGNAETARQRLVTDNRLGEMIYTSSAKGTGVQKSLTEYAVDPVTNLVAPRTTQLNSGPAFAMEPRLTYHQYDNKGNLLSVSKENDVRESYIWDYQGSLPVAKVTNATPGNIAYSSFESDGTGNLYIGQPLNIQTGNGITGRKCYAINGVLARFNLDPAKTYIVSLWTKNGIPDYNGYNGATLVTPSANAWTQGRTVRGWTYREKKLSGVTTINIGGGGGLVDEVRIYPADAQMGTYTYDPLIGISSQCDVNNRIAYYEYDGFSRLLRIRDEDSSILKQYDYQYQQYGHSNPVWQATDTTRCKPCDTYPQLNTNIQQRKERDVNLASSSYNTTRWVDIGVSATCGAGNCNPTIYYNAAYTYRVQRNDCSPGTISSQACVYVPANQFQAFSQLEADNLAKAWAEQQAIQQGLVTCLGTGVYARLEIDNTIYTDYSVPPYFYEYDYDVHLYIRIYSDPQCTQPLVLTGDLDFKLIRHNSWLTWNGSPNQSGSDEQTMEWTVPSGNSELQLDDIANLYSYYQNEDPWYITEGWTYFQLTKKSPHTGVNYVIRPVKYNITLPQGYNYYDPNYPCPGQ